MKFEKKRLLIVGAGGFGREVYNWSIQICLADPEVGWYPYAFLDSKKNSLENPISSIPIIGKPEDYVPDANDIFIIAIGDQDARERIAHCLKNKEARFARIIHHTVICADLSQIGEGCIICPYAVISADVLINDFVIINTHSTIGHDVKIEEFVTISSHVDVPGRCIIQKKAFIGSHASMLPGTIIGEEARVGACSLAIDNVASRTSVFGVPAKVIFSK